MKDNLERCIEFTRGWEGGDTDDPNDPGGLTRFGIAQNMNPEIDVAGLTWTDARHHWVRKWWQPLRCDDLWSGLDLVCFEGSFNQGETFMRKALQRAVGVTADGALGPLTMAAIAKADAETLLREVLLRRQMRYTRLDNWPRYGKGWTRRLMACSIKATHFYDYYGMMED